MRKSSIQNNFHAYDTQATTLLTLYPYFQTPKLLTNIINSRKLLRFSFLVAPSSTLVVSVFSHYFLGSKHIYALHFFFLESTCYVLFSFTAQESKIGKELAPIKPTLPASPLYRDRKCLAYSGHKGLSKNLLNDTRFQLLSKVLRYC